MSKGKMIYQYYLIDKRGIIWRRPRWFASELEAQTKADEIFKYTGREFTVRGTVVEMRETH